MAVTVQRLSMDSSWWISIGGVRLLVDPWLIGPEVDYARWFNTQWHATPPVPLDTLPTWDVVLISQKYPDHLHAETLRSLDPEEVWAPEHTHAALGRILPRATLRDARREVIRRGELTVRWLASRRRIDPIYEAVVLDDGTDSIVLAPHGLVPDADHRGVLAECSPCVALLAPLRRYQLPAVLGGAVAPGAQGLGPLVEAVEPRWIVPTHDEDKRGTGLVPRLARVTPFDPAAHPKFASRVCEVPDYSPRRFSG